MKLYLILTVLTALLAVISCSGPENGFEFRDQGNFVPEFSSENAFRYIDEQVAMGPRVPGTVAHEETRNYFIEQ